MGRGYDRPETAYELAEWLETIPAAALLPAGELAELARTVADLEPGDVGEPMDDQSGAPKVTWRERLWLVPPETRIGVPELAEAIGRSLSTVYKLTSGETVPHRKVDGELVFVVGEIRAWIEERETVVVGPSRDDNGPSVLALEKPKRSRRQGE